MDRLFRNGQIWVQHGQWAEALTVRDQRVLAVGDEDQVRASLDAAFEVIDMEGGMLMPGFHDGHLHLLMGGFSLLQLSLDGMYDRDQVLAAIRNEVTKIEREGGDDRWLLGIGYDENRVHITKEDLSRLCPNLPAMIRTRDLHSAIVNNLAITRAGITRSTPDPPTGKIERDADGEATGILREEAVWLVDSLVPAPDQELSLQAIDRAQAEAFRFGITSVSDSIRPKNLPAYEEFHRSGMRRIRINGWRVLEDWNLDGVPPVSMRNLGFQVRTLKGFVDGAMGSDTAWLLEDFTHRPGYRGIGNVQEEELTGVVTEALKLGYSVTMHAIGDRANRVTLNAYEKAGVTSDQRHRIEHAQLLASDDIPRFGAKGIIASMQPIHCTDDMAWKIRKVGAERVKNAYPWRSLIKTGAVLIFGTDWPVADLNPMQGLRAAVTRQGANGNPQEGWNVDQALMLEEALDIYTRAGAFGAGWESQVGTLEPGKWADMILLDKNLFELHPLEYVKAKVRQTWVDGEKVMDRDER